MGAELLSAEQLGIVLTFTLHTSVGIRKQVQVNRHDVHNLLLLAAGLRIEVQSFERVQEGMLGGALQFLEAWDHAVEKFPALVVRIQLGFKVI